MALVSIVLIVRTSLGLPKFKNNVFTGVAPQADIVAGASYAYKSGASMAAPHVAGAFAVLKSAVPNASVGDIENALKQSGQLTSDSVQNSRSLTLSFNGQNVTIAIDSNSTTFVDFPSVSGGEHVLTLTANNEDVSLSIVETILY